MRIRTGNRRRAQAHARAEANRIKLQRFEKLRRELMRALIKRVVAQFEDLILYGEEATVGTRSLAKAFRGFASGGTIDPAARAPWYDLGREFAVPSERVEFTGRNPNGSWKVPPRFRMADDLPLIIPTPIKVINNP